MPPPDHLFYRIDVTGNASIGFFQCVWVVFLQPLPAIIGKAVGSPLFPWTVVCKASFPAVLFHGVGKVNKGVFSFLRKVQQWDAMVGNVWPQLGQPANGRSVIQHGSSLSLSLPAEKIRKQSGAFLR